MMRRLLLCLFLFLALAGCGDDDAPPGECKGVGDAGAGAATITSGATTIRYGEFRWGENNDCPAPGSQVISVTITSSQVDPPGDLGIGLCLPRPDAIGAAPIQLSDRTQVELVGASGSAGGCVLAPSFGAVPTGTVTFGGFCTAEGANFQVTLAGSIAGTKSCGADAGPAENVTLTLGGTALVTPR